MGARAECAGGVVGRALLPREREKVDAGGGRMRALGMESQCRPLLRRISLIRHAPHDTFSRPCGRRSEAA